jgi:Protein of unknown function (Hypoth_ymh)
LETESETSLQAGMEQLLRGLYQAFRNPRSHGEKINDSQPDSDAVIIFVNHLIKIIGLAKTEFTLETCVERILEENFVPSSRYAELIVSEIPTRQCLDVTLSVYQRKDAAEGKKLRFFFDAVIPKLSAGERSDFFAAVSTELREASTDSEIRVVLQCLQPETWLDLDEIARLRIEHRLINDTKDGRYDDGNKRCVGGSLETWGRAFFPFFTLREEALRTLVAKLWSNSREQQDYVFEYFFSSLDTLSDVPTSGFETAVIWGLDLGDERFYNAVNYRRPWKDLPPSTRFEKALEGYREKHPVDDDDEVPF